MERDYIGHIYQIRYGVLRHVLEKLPDGIFLWASSIKSDIYGSLSMEIGYLKVESAWVQSLAR